MTYWVWFRVDGRIQDVQVEPDQGKDVDVEVNLRSWYPVFLVRFLVRRALRRERKETT